MFSAQWEPLQCSSEYCTRVHHITGVKFDQMCVTLQK